MIINVDYLIQKFSEAREKSHIHTSRKGKNYWTGVMDTYHSLLNMAFEGWAEHGSVGYYVFMKGMSYDAAIGAYQRNLTKEEI